MQRASRISTGYLADSIRVIALVGEHDLCTRQIVLAELERVTAPGVAVIVDLSAAEFIDSTMLRILIIAHKRAESTVGTTLAVVVSLDSGPARIFEVTDARALFPIFASLDEAIASSSHSTLRTAGRGMTGTPHCTSGKDDHLDRRLPVVPA